MMLRKQTGFVCSCEAGEVCVDSVAEEKIKFMRVTGKVSGFQFLFSGVVEGVS
jgi:hypothetical protein